MAKVAPAAVPTLRDPCARPMAAASASSAETTDPSEACADEGIERGTQTRERPVVIEVV